ncbi:glycosyltransferase, partial [Puniceibacterium antarcticum]|uniref:glycosyltransferase n=1 Tax=Puniceibacterium antarcticum TaxID=1206336 RepID=UPI00117AB7C8
MRAPISIILPTLDARDGLAETIPSLMEGLEAGLVRELILSDGGSTDATRAVADAAGAIWLSAPVARAQRLRRGAG